LGAYEPTRRSPAPSVIHIHPARFAVVLRVGFLWSQHFARRTRNANTLMTAVRSPVQVPQLTGRELACWQWAPPLSGWFSEAPPIRPARRSGLRLRKLAGPGPRKMNPAVDPQASCTRPRGPCPGGNPAGNVSSAAVGLTHDESVPLRDPRGDPRVASLSPQEAMIETVASVYNR